MVQGPEVEAVPGAAPVAVIVAADAGAIAVTDPADGLGEVAPAAVGVLRPPGVAGLGPRRVAGPVRSRTTRGSLRRRRAGGGGLGRRGAALCATARGRGSADAEGCVPGDPEGVLEGIVRCVTQGAGLDPCNGRLAGKALEAPQVALRCIARGLRLHVGRVVLVCRRPKSIGVHKGARRGHLEAGDHRVLPRGRRWDGCTRGGSLAHGGGLACWGGLASRDSRARRSGRRGGPARRGDPARGSGRRGDLARRGGLPRAGEAECRRRGASPGSGVGLGRGFQTAREGCVASPGDRVRRRCGLPGGAGPAPGREVCAPGPSRGTERRLQ